MEGTSNGIAKSTASIEKIAEYYTQLNKALPNELLEAPGIVEKMVDLDLEHNLGIGVSPIKLLAEYIKKASDFKKWCIAEKISKVNITTKALILRELQAIGATGIPWESCLLETRENSLWRFKKPRRTMAYGQNAEGKLGIGTKELTTDGLMTVELPVDIVDVVIGKNHTIFRAKNGELYGCGKMKNFMEGMENSEETIYTPVKLESYRLSEYDDPSKLKIIAGNDYTLISDEHKILIIGNFDSLRVNNIRASGPNWIIRNYTAEKIPSKKGGPDECANIYVYAHDGMTRKIHIHNQTKCHSAAHATLSIFFRVNGVPVDSEVMRGKYKIGKNEQVFALIDGNLYSGKLEIAQKDCLNCGTDETGVPSKIRKCDVLMCELEEMPSPCAFDDFKLTRNGESLIAFTLSDALQLEPLDCFHKYYPSFRMEPIYLKPRRDPEPSFDGFYLLGTFEFFCSNLDIKRVSDAYNEDGLPREIDFVRGLLALVHFLRLDEKTGHTKVFMDSVRENHTLDMTAVTTEMESALEMGCKIPVLVVKADMISKERGKEMKNKSRDYLLGLMETVKNLLRKFNEIPLKYRKNSLENNFGFCVNEIFRSITERTDDSPDCPEPVLGTFKAHLFENTLKARLANQELQGDEERWKVLRVEAVGLIDNHNHHAFWMYTTRFHISCIDESLLEHIDEENGVLNLNLICLHDSSNQRFKDFIDVFFWHRDEDLKSFQSKIDVQEATSRLAKKDKYTVVIANDVEIEVPKVLLEVYSEFDAARRRSVRDEEELNLFVMEEYSEETWSLLMRCLIDERVYYGANMDLKIDVYKLAEYLLITHLRPTFLQFIVLTATEKDAYHISYLLWDKPEEMATLIGKHRPEIVMFWKNVSFTGLKSIHAIAKEIEANHFERMTEPLTVGMTQENLEMIDRKQDGFKIILESLFSRESL